MRVTIKLPDIMEIEDINSETYRLIKEIKSISDYDLKNGFKAEKSHSDDHDYFILAGPLSNTHMPRGWCKEVDPFDEKYKQLFPYAQVDSTHYWEIKKGWLWHREYLRKQKEEKVK